jgi:hypothetical protein
MFHWANGEWRNYSCFGGLPCEFTAASAEYKFWKMYKDLKEVSILHAREEYFGSELERLGSIDYTHDERFAWLIKHEKQTVSLFYEIGIDYWASVVEIDEWLEPTLRLNVDGKRVYIENEDFENGLMLLQACHKIRTQLYLQ